ncbi:MAG: C39 family peptidase, partial [Ruminococcus sp.]
MKVHKTWNGIIGFLTACCCLVSGSGLSVVAEDAVTTLTVEEPIAAEILPEGTPSTEETESSTTTTAPTTTETTVETTETISEGLDDEAITLGDLNGDGAVSVEDAVFVLTIYAKQSAGLEVNLSPQQFFCLDCDHDTKISVEDAVLILEYYAKHAACLVTGTFSEYVDEKQNPATTTTVTELTTLPETSTEITTETTTKTTLPTTTTTTIPTTTTITTTTTTTTTTATTTTTTTTTTTDTTTTTTTTTAMPNSVNLPVNCILQNASPSLPTGCEATALTIALNYDGFAAEKTNIAKIYLPKMVFYTLNDIYYGADFQYVFPGDPTTSYGYGCYAPAIVATANAYFTAQKNASYAENISGTSFYDLFPYLAAGRPIVFWGTMNMCAPGTGGSWTTPDGETVTWKSNEHCLVLTGYNKSAGTVQVADPLRGNVSYDMELVAQRYTQMGKQA